MLALVTVAFAGNLVRFYDAYDYVRFGDIDPGEEYTVETWIWFDTVQEFNTIFEATDAAGYDSLYLGFDEGSWLVEINDQTQSEGDSCGDRAIDDLCSDAYVPVAYAWQHVALTGTPTELVLYIDGAEVARQSVSTTPAWGVDWVVGADTEDGVNFNSDNLAARLDEMRVWSVARSAAEIRCTMDWAAHGDERGLEAAWHFDEAGGSATASDATANGWTGTLFGDTVFQPSNAGSAGTLTASAGLDIPCIDYDADGYSADGGDCDESDAGIHPGAADVGGDGIDQDCDGLDVPGGGDDTGGDSGDTDPPDSGDTDPPDSGDTDTDAADRNGKKRGGITTPGACSCGSGAAPAGWALGLGLLALTARRGKGTVR